jgi:L-alanine-DL-glutamate epimerase-like enolase superfamily enzyme
MTQEQGSMNRRGLLRRAGALAAAGPLFKMTEGPVSAQARSRVNTASAPSKLRITDLRGLTIDPGWASHDFPLIRIDTNQGVYGLGEVFCGNVWTQAAILKPFLVGRDPLQLVNETLMASMRHYGGDYPMGGGISGIDVALYDLAGKAYGVPAWRLLGNKRTDRVLLYCDTDTQGEPDTKAYAAHMTTRKKAGFRFFKTDLGGGLVRNRPGAHDSRGVCTQKGLEYLCEYLAAVRDVIGEAPLACDHFGRCNVDDAIRYAKAFEPYNLAWAEDFIDATGRDWRGYKKITESTRTPILTGENGFGLEERFRDLLDNRAVTAIHPDVCNSGGMLEVKRIADYAAVCGINTAFHQPGSPVAAYASAHVAATLAPANFLALEFHCAEVPFWDDLVTGAPKPTVNDGYLAVPDTPGLGIELNEPVVKEHLRRPGYAAVNGYFEPSTMFDIPLIGSYRQNPPRLPAAK